MTARQPQTRFEAAMLGLTGLGYPAVTAGPQPAGVQRGAPLAPNRPRGLFGASVRSRPFQVGMGSAAFAGDAGDRKSVVQGKSVSVRVDLGCRRILYRKPNRDTY